MHDGFIGWIILFLLISATSRAEDSWPSDRPSLPYELDYVNQAGFQYLYKMTLEKMPIDNKTLDRSGTFEIREPETNKIMYKETLLYPDGCPGTKFARPRALKTGPRQSNFVVVCDTDEGHYSTLRLFENSRLVAKLDYVIVAPNLTWHSEYQTYLAVVYYTDNSLIGTGTDYLRMIYEWKPYNDENSGFHPIFNSHSYKLYLDEYKRYQQNKPVHYLTLLAELVATSKASLICSELTKLPLKKLSQSQLKEYMAIDERYGFPPFDFSICKGVAGNERDSSDGY